MKGAPVAVAVTLHLSPVAHGLLLTLAAHNDQASVEECILAELAGCLSAWCEDIAADANMEAIFTTAAAPTQAKDIP